MISDGEGGRSLDDPGVLARLRVVMCDAFNKGLLPMDVGVLFAHLTGVFSFSTGPAENANLSPGTTGDVSKNVFTGDTTFELPAVFVGTLCVIEVGDAVQHGASPNCRRRSSSRVLHCCALILHLSVLACFVLNDAEPSS